MASTSSSAKPDKPSQEDVVDAMGRKMWDKDYYMEKAKNHIMFGPERIGKRKDPFIPLPASQRTYLKQRNNDLQLDKNLGQHQVVTTHTIKPMQGGYWCSVCECLLKDSATYLDHVNGRRHNRNLGMNMKVEKIGVDRVKEKLRAMKKEPQAAEPEDIAAKIQALEEEQEEKKRRKKEKKKKKKKGPDDEAGEKEPAEKKAKLGHDEDDVTGDEEEAEGDGDEDGDDGPEEDDEETKMLK
eukprot:CAMPEP_0169333698 /NCGR_PEP_ID=MMETSP1017-20121227/15397_1 /TAXON_ID=342587 /ORGANISM="Karlodinium micrum, Strain CCMP2283" /LENGTH=239 /DNA_ID=CAMNT_0009428935 /DNA_START=80 /DNA_END=796 /DNA_ORIENTATION=+